MALNKAITNPTNPGTLRPDFFPELIIKNVFNFFNFLDFDYNIKFPNIINNSNAFAIWSFFFSNNIF